MGTLAASFTVAGLHGWFQLIAAILFAAAAVTAWFAAPRAVWAAFVASGLCLITVALLVSG